jgi:hypothetical protein
MTSGLSEGSTHQGGDQQNKVALPAYKWTMASLLTPRDLKQARIDFICDNTDLHQAYWKLAKAMKEEQLHASTAEIRVIARQITGWIDAAKELGRL